jgi:hypothetical protein
MEDERRVAGGDQERSYRGGYDRDYGRSEGYREGRDYGSRRAIGIIATR